MSATDEIRRAAADLRKAAQLRKDELRDHHTSLSKAKNDHDALVVALKAEQSAVEQRMKDPNDPNPARDMQNQVDDVNSRLVRFKDQHDNEVRTLEQRIRELEQQITDYEQKAVQLEQQAV